MLREARLGGLGCRSLDGGGGKEGGCTGRQMGLAVICDKKIPIICPF